MKIKGLGKDMSKGLRNKAAKQMPEFGISDGEKVPTPKIPMPKVKAFAKGGAVSEKKGGPEIARHNALMHKGQPSRLKKGGRTGGC